MDGIIELTLKAGAVAAALAAILGGPLWVWRLLSARREAAQRAALEGPHLERIHNKWKGHDVATLCLRGPNANRYQVNHARIRGRGVRLYPGSGDDAITAKTERRWSERAPAESWMQTSFMFTADEGAEVWAIVAYDYKSNGKRAGELRIRLR